MSFASCAMDHEIVSNEQERKPIALTSVTKATNGETTTTPFNSGDVWLWAKKSNGTEYIKAWHLNANGSGGFTSSSGEKYWPNDGSRLTFYALHGNLNTTISENTTSWDELTSLTHTVKSDQSTESARNSSDLLYAKEESVASNTTPVNLTFDHVLSKLCITLKKADAIGIQDANLQNAKVEVIDINTVVTYNATNNSVTAPGTPTTVILGQETSGSTTYVGIVPSEMTVAPSVKITLNDFPIPGKTRDFSCNLNSVTFAKGNKYTFTLTLHNEIVVSSPTITPWTKDSDTNVPIPPASVDSN